MAIGIDGASPAVASGGNVTTATTASFTRPAAGSMLVAMVMATSTADPVVSGGSLTWTRQKQQTATASGAYAETWTAPVTGSGAMTVTVTIVGAFRFAALKVDGVTGQHATLPIGNSGGGVSAANNITPTGYTSSADGSRGFFAAIELNGLGNPTSTDTGFAWTANNSLADTSGIAVRKSANTSGSGVAVTFNADAPGAGAADWTWAALEILPASLDAPVTTTTVATATTVPAPAVTVAVSKVPPTVATSTTVPAPAVGAGAGAHPATVTVTTAVPLPAVTTQDVTQATPATVTAATTVPAPAVSAGSRAAPDTVAAAAAVPAPAVRVDASVMLSIIAVEVAIPAPAAVVPPLPGDRITRAGQIEWDGFLIGSGTPYSWQGLQGWRKLPPWISGNVDRPDSSGSYEGQPFAGERVVNYGMLIKSPRAQIAQVLRDLQMATGIAQSEDEGSLVIWDLDGAEPYLAYGHLSDRDPGEINMQARLGLMRGALQWTCSDPAIYSPIRQSVPIPVGVETDVLNDGNEASTRVTLRVPGPAAVVQIENLTTDRVIAFDVDIPDGQILEIEVRYGTAVIGSVNHIDDLIEGSAGVTDMVLAPGPNRLLYTAETGGSLMDVLWRHAST